MGRQRNLNIIWPMAGYNTRLPKVAQPPYSTPDCCNVWVKDSVIENNRLGGGSRPGLLRSYIGQITNPVLMNTLRCYRSTDIGDKNYSVIDEEFSGVGLSNAWTALPNNITPTTVNPGQAYANQNNSAAWVYKSVPIDDSKSYMIEALQLPYLYEQTGTVEIYAGMNDSSPDPEEDGITISFTRAGATQWQATVVSFEGGVQQEIYSDFVTILDSGMPWSGWLRVQYDTNTAPGKDEITVWIRDAKVLDAVEVTHSVDAGTRLGFGLFTQQATEIAIQRFRVQYYPTGTVEKLRYQLFASGNGYSYVQDGFNGQMNELTGAISLASDYPLASTSNQGKLYIADYGLKLSGTDGVIGNLQIPVADYSVDSNNVVTLYSNDTNQYLSVGVPITIQMNDDTLVGINGSYIVTALGTDGAQTTFSYTGNHAAVAKTAADAAATATGMGIRLGDLPNLSGLGIDATTDMVLMQGQVTPTVIPARAYNIKHIDTFFIVLTESAQANNNESGTDLPQSYQIGRAPKYYDPNAAAVADSIVLWNTELYSDDEPALDIIGLQIVSGVAQVTVSIPHGLEVGDTVVIDQTIPTTNPAPYTTASPQYPFSGTWVVASVPTATAFTFETSADDIPVADAKGRWAVTKKRLLTNVARLTTSTANTIKVNDTALVALEPADGTFDGTYAITVSATPPPQVSYAKTASNVTETASGGFIRTAGGTVEKVLGRKGVVPWNCSLMCLYRGRIVMAGDIENPQQFYMSRIGNAFDFDYGADATDPARAWSSTLSTSGEIGDTITALIPLNDDYLLIGCRSSIWLVRGDPAQGGLIDNVSRTVGIVQANSWCYLQHNAGVMFFSNNGIWLWSPGGYNDRPGLQNVSSDVIPNAFLNVNPAQFKITMMWDTYWRAAHVYLTPLNAGNRMYHYWIWMEEGKPSFWPVTMQSDFEPLFLADYRPENNTDNAVLMLGRDGQIREYWSGAWTDDLTNMEGIYKYITLGPIKLGGDEFSNGLLTCVQGILPRRSGDISWDLFVGNSALSALPNPLQNTYASMGESPEPVAGGAFEPLRSYMSRPNKRGVDAYIRLLFSPLEAGAYESLLVTKEQSGEYTRTSRTGK